MEIAIVRENNKRNFMNDRREEKDKYIKVEDEVL